MLTLYHREEHFRSGATVKDIVIGMSDGLTVPFALAAGISGAISAAHIVVTAGSFHSHPTSPSPTSERRSTSRSRSR